ncbi:MAG: SGNH/GDSL hydrolase family protein [Prevotellaceae bacterium]|jgi:lysophospholipase L1-like esterase|nr:SGNH/GDSL hydrolase family protein [Prevotellaceae bacterium]
MNTRRKFLRNTALAGMGMALIPEIVKATVQESTGKKNVILKKNSVILFQGDSITDAGRKREAVNCNSIDMLGMGYSLFTATSILKKHADKQPKIYNRGISGNKVFQLRERWEIDTLAFMPDVLSILIGVNDYWHTLTGGYKGTLEVYENDLRNLLKYTKEKLPNVQLVICEPFILKGGSAIKENEWLPMFNDYRIAAKKLATEFKTIFVPYQTAFDEAVKAAPARYWSADGVHPDLPGRQLMAEVWLKATGL